MVNSTINRTARKMEIVAALFNLSSSWSCLSALSDLHVVIVNKRYVRCIVAAPARGMYRILHQMQYDSLAASLVAELLIFISCVLPRMALVDLDGFESILDGEQTNEWTCCLSKQNDQREKPHLTSPMLSLYNWLVAHWAKEGCTANNMIDKGIYHKPSTE